MSNSTFSRILVAVDGSQASLHALKETCRLVRAERGSVAAVSVVPPHDGELRLVGVSNVMEKMHAPAKKALADAARVAELEGVPLQTYALQGEPHEVIVTLAAEKGYDLIALGVKGHNVCETVLMGSTTARVIGFGHTPVLVIPFECRLTWQRILVPVDGSASGDQAARLAFELVDAYGSELLVVSVADVPPHVYGISAGAAGKMIAQSREHLENVASEAQANEINADFVLREGEPAEILIELATHRSSDLIIMGSHGRSGLARLLMGSVTERVIQGSPCPILVVRDSRSSKTEHVAGFRSHRPVRDVKGVYT